MNRALPASIVISLLTLAACGDGGGPSAGAPKVIAVFVGDSCDALRPSLVCPVPPARGNITIVFDRLLQGNKVVDLGVNEEGGLQQVPIGLEAGTPRLPVALEAGGVSMEGRYAVAYTAGGKVDPDSGAIIAGIGPGLIVTGVAGTLVLPPFSDVIIHLVPEMVVSQRGGMEYADPDISFRNGAVDAPDAGTDAE